MFGEGEEWRTPKLPRARLSNGGYTCAKTVFAFLGGMLQLACFITKSRLRGRYDAPPADFIR